MSVLSEMLMAWKEAIIAVLVLGGALLFFGILFDFFVDYAIEHEKLKEEQKHCKSVNNKWRNI